MQLLEVIFQIWRCSRRELKRGGLYQVHDPAVQLSIVPYNVGNPTLYGMWLIRVN